MRPSGAWRLSLRAPRHRQHRDRGRALPAAPRGIDTGLDHDRLALLVEWLAERVPDKITGQLARAGWFGA
ncbi:hypothetical protein FLP41_07540 [Paracoccus marcusii]|uniref:hypothetical protein n=1 Tax=Paracoccus marcusii TaxID=59779 RepID=UPI002ED4BE05|nr:hypothetical protein FLP41_07540 [Paracoccus marcusii]